MQHSPRAQIGQDGIPDAADRPTLTVEEVAALLRISRGLAYEGVANGEIPSLRVGKRIVIPTARLRRLLGLDGADPPTVGKGVHRA